MIKLHILYNFQEQTWGGGNQFLLALKKQFECMGCYVETPKEADVILFNSYPFRAEHFFDQLFHLKKRFPKKLIVYRLNGPISFIRGKDTYVDRVIRIFNDMLADGIIFQSTWCQTQNKKYFGISSRFETVIHNAPDSDIFNQNEKTVFDPQKKINLIMASWSTNPRKGFDVYRYLDEHLDFSKYNATFVGNSPIRFEHIRTTGTLTSSALAQKLKQHDIFITASQNDPCSNALIEALSCGLPAVALNDGGHPELVQHGGLLFHGTEDVIAAIEQATQNYMSYQSHIPSFDIQKTARAYYAFAKNLFQKTQVQQCTPKRVTPRARMLFFKLKAIIFFHKTMRFVRMSVSSFVQTSSPSSYGKTDTR